MAEKVLCWRDCIRAAANQLAAAGVDSPQLDAELLAGHLLGRSVTMVRLVGHEQPSAALAAQYAELVARRAQRVPLPYLVGYQEFMGRRLHCDPRALIPRWDSEVLVESIIAWCSARPALVLADIGTGSGAVAVSLAAELPQAVVWATDLSPAALALAASNAAQCGVADRVQFRQGHLLEPLPTALAFDGIVANLPYIPSAELASLQPEVREHEPRAALDGGDDGLELLRELAVAAHGRLVSRGFLLLEHADDQQDTVVELLTQNGYADVACLADLGGRPRAVRGVVP